MLLTGKNTAKPTTVFQGNNYETSGGDGQSS